MRRIRVTPIGGLARGLLAGAAGTAAMDLLWYRRYRQGGGESGFTAWEFASGAQSWEQAPAPAQVGRRLYEGFFQRGLPTDDIARVNNVTHWGYGAGWGAVYGAVVGSLRPAPRLQRLLYGLPFGATVWTSSYILLPLAKLYKPIWQYDSATLAKDLTAHLTYGLTTGVVFTLLGGPPRRAPKSAPVRARVTARVAAPTRRAASAPTARELAPAASLATLLPLAVEAGRAFAAGLRVGLAAQTRPRPRWNASPRRLRAG